jgi:hypothetical protein
MSKILIEEINDIDSCDKEPFFNKNTKIYPIDYVYCETYIKEQLSITTTKSSTNSDESTIYFNMMCIFSLLLLLMQNVMLLYIYNIADISILFMFIIYDLIQPYRPLYINTESYRETKKNDEPHNPLIGQCYTCGVDLFHENMIKMTEYEYIYLSCGHIHHTSCLLSDYIQKHIGNHNDCNYCNSEQSLDVLKHTVEDAYYASILMYDLKNGDNDFCDKMKQKLRSSYLNK